MKNQLSVWTLVLISIMGLSSIGYTQPIYKVKSDGFNLKLLGTSSMHDWEMEATTSSGDAQFLFKPGSTSDLVSIQSLTFDLVVKDLKSDNTGLDKNAYDALKEDSYKDICYKLTSSTLTHEDSGYLIKSIGTLTIAGVTNEILMDVHCEINDAGAVISTGSYKLNMKDYQVDPPSFMWGAMKTGNEIELEFVVVYKKEKGV